MPGHGRKGQEGKQPGLPCKGLLLIARISAETWAHRYREAARTSGLVLAVSLRDRGYGFE